MTLLSLFPAVGSGIVWLPAAIILIINGSLAKGLVLIGIGTCIIGLVDNLLRPLLVGREMRLPDYLILLATLGGFATFGISGFVIGPLIAVLFVTIWKMIQEDYAHEEPEQCS
jgi:predicted PurR-regulated permease PerM